MPGEFETVFAYNIDNYAKAENLIQGILTKYHINGEWFNLKQDELEHIKKTCEMMGGKSVTDEFDDDIKTETEIDFTETYNEINDEAVNINGINVPLHKNKNESTQDFVKKYYIYCLIII